MHVGNLGQQIVCGAGQDQSDETQLGFRQILHPQVIAF